MRKIGVCIAALLAIATETVSRNMKGRTEYLSLLAIVGAVALVCGVSPAFAETTVNLGTAANFAVLAGEKVTDIPTSDIHGDVGLSPASGSLYSGLTAAEVTGTIYAVDALGPLGSINNPGLLTTAKNDLITAYDDAAGRTATTIASELGGQTLTPGVYDSTEGTFLITGTLTLDAGGDPNAVFIFQTTSTVITATNSVVDLINGAQSCNVFWKVGSSATIETNSDFKGNILALTSISLKTGATISGRALARNAAVTMDTNTITASICENPTPTAAATETATATATATETATATATETATETATPPPTPIPEFPTVALPIISVIGLMYMFYRGKGK